MSAPRLLTLLISIASIAACADAPPLAGNTTRSEIAAGDSLPEPSVQEVAGRGREYGIGPFDRLSVDVFGIEALQQRQVQADGSGRISFPIAGTIEAAGMTLLEFQEELRKRLVANYVREPQVTVNLLEVRSQVVTVEGEVGKPGLYPVLGDMTLLKSLATAEGLEEYAKDDIVVFRTVDGQKYAGIYNVAAIRSGVYADPPIFGGDVVIVGESAQKRRFDKVLAAVPAFLSPLVLLIR